MGQVNFQEHAECSNNGVVNGTLISPEKRLDFVVNSSCEFTPTQNKTTTSSNTSNHDYSNFNFPNGQNLHHFAKLVEDHQNGPLLVNDESNSKNIQGEVMTSQFSSSLDKLGHKQINTSQMVRPIPKFTTFRSMLHGQTEGGGPKNGYSMTHDFYGSQLHHALASGSEEDIHRALPIYLPSEGSGDSSASCASINDAIMSGNNGSIFSSYNNSLVTPGHETDDAYRQQLHDAAKRFNNINRSEQHEMQNGTNTPQQFNSNISIGGMSSNGHEESIHLLNRPPPLPARLHPPSTGGGGIHQIHQQQPSQMSFFSPMLHQFPGRSVKPICKNTRFLIISIT